MRARERREVWASDTPISRPEPAKNDIMRDFRGLAFTMDGICHNLSEADIEEMFTPMFAPDPAPYEGESED